jgi:hypothetical protein
MVRRCGKRGYGKTVCKKLQLVFDWGGNSRPARGLSSLFLRLGIDLEIGAGLELSNVRGGKP